MNEVADVWIFPVERLPLVAPALLDEPVGDDAELLPVDECLPVGVRGGGDKERVDLTMLTLLVSLCII